MKNLWTVLPPLLSDNNGLIEVIKSTDGCAIIDDSGEFRLGGGHSHGGHGGRMDGRRGSDGFGGGYVGHGGHGGGHGGRGGGKGGKGSDSRTVVSGASSQDVTTGTRDAMMDAFQSARSRFDPNFVLLSAGPCGAMIGTDLKEIAETITNEYHIPAAAVDLTGQKAYDVGISKTTEAMAKLLSEPGEARLGTLNILGATALDWSTEDVNEAKNWAAQQGWQVLTQPGSTVTAAQLADMGKAQLNWVTTVSGLAAARYLQNTFGTPYVVGTPFGIKQVGKLADLMQTPALPDPTEPFEVDTLIIGEQFAANALRDALESKGFAKGADVATFYQLDKKYARRGDRKIKGEADARELLNSAKYRLIVADPILRSLLKSDCEWVDLPHKAMNPYSECTPVSLFGSKLDKWLDSCR